MMRETYKQIAEKTRILTGRAPKFSVDYFTRREVKNAIENNKFYSHACVQLGLLQKGSKSPFNALRNMNKLIGHYKLKHTKLGSRMPSHKIVRCPHCQEKFDINLDIK